LVYLGLTQNKLTLLPSEMRNLNNLSYLYSYDNNLTELPLKIKNLVNLGYFGYDKSLVTIDEPFIL
jgi:Leucine-rich repeat (LRR) protein